MAPTGTAGSGVARLTRRSFGGIVHQRAARGAVSMAGGGVVGETMADGLQFLNAAEARAVEAMAARVIPGDDRDPGAHEAEVLTYIDRALAGAYRSAQPVYRRGLWELERLCRHRHGGSFADLAPELQDEVLGEIGEPPPTHPQFASEDAGPHASEVLYELFAHVRRHTIEGFFADPQYGGNRDAAGWRLVGFPGAQWGYDREQMTLGFDATAIPVKTLADLRRERGG